MHLKDGCQRLQQLPDSEKVRQQLLRQAEAARGLRRRPALDIGCAFALGAAALLFCGLCCGCLPLGSKLALPAQRDGPVLQPLLSTMNASKQVVNQS